MSTRQSFLSTTGLIRPSSAMSTLSMADNYTTPSHASSGSTRPGRRPIATVPPQPPKMPSQPPTTRAGILPLGPGFLLGMAVTLSLLFILVIMCVFIPDNDETPMFAGALDGIAANSPGIVLIGVDVDVDVDEPALSIRWSIIGCGQEYVLPGSQGTHGSQNCGLPAMPLQIFVDGGEQPVATFNPSILPVFTGGQRHSIQNMFQFDDDHVLDVHEARLYPFDTYHLTSTFRAVSTATNETLPIQKLATIPITSSFVSFSSDSASSVTATDGSNQSSRDLDLQVFRPADARTFALLLFGTSWMLSHATVGLVALSWYLNNAGKVLQHLASTFLVMLLIPQLRNAMPDAPGFDGVLIDAVGFFPQMLVCAASAIVLFGMMVKRELGYLEESSSARDENRKEAPAPLSTGLLKMRRGSVSVDIRHVRNFSKSISSFVRTTPGS